MKLEIIENTSVKIKQLRKKVRTAEDGSDTGWRLSVRNGKLFSQVKVDIVQPRTEEQMKNWALFTEANRRVMIDFRSKEKAKEWKKRAVEYGYKTARGCARAYYLEKIKTKVDKITDARDKNMDNLVVVKTLKMNLEASISDKVRRHRMVVDNGEEKWSEYRNVWIWKKVARMVEV